MSPSRDGLSRLRRKWRWYGRPRDLLPLFNTVLAGALAVNTYSTHPEITTVVGTLYFLSLLLFYLNTIRDRRAKVRIPTMSISHSDLMPISSERSDARLSHCEIVIDIRQDFSTFSTANPSQSAHFFFGADVRSP